jgi:hypothetical protein|tara:strand:+ start:742 stop:1131 length:390 start_codon:yes stop_codon:yes gene_type:complete
MSYLSTFTTYIQEFIDKLCGHYPEDKDFSNFKAYIIILKKTNPRAILNLFNTHCIKYTEQIKTKDEKFLLTTDFTKDKINIENVINDDNAFDIINKIRNYWKLMDTPTKESIWQYLNLFIMLSSKISKD